MLIHEAFHNQTHVGLSCVSLVLTLAVKEMLYLSIQTIIPHDPYICQFIYSNWKNAVFEHSLIRSLWLEKLPKYLNI